MEADKVTREKENADRKAVKRAICVYVSRWDVKRSANFENRLQDSSRYFILFIMSRFDSERMSGILRRNQRFFLSRTRLAIITSGSTMREFFE